MRAPIPPRRSAVFLTLLALPLLLSRAPGQGIDAGERALKDADTKELRALRGQLFKGDLPAKAEDKEHVDALDLEAKRVIYPLAWATHQVTPGQIAKAFDEFEKDLAQFSRYKPNTDVATRIFCRKAIEHAQEVIAKGKPIGAVNGARILARIPERPAAAAPAAALAEVLPRLAEGNGELLAQALVSQVKQKGNDAVRYYGLKGLRELLSLPPQTPPLVKKETEDAAYQEAQQIVDQGFRFPSGATRDEIDGFRVLRREAVRVLAQNRAAGRGDKTKVAVSLLRIAGVDARVRPAPRVDERLEAAIGLARLRPDAGSRDYQPDYAIKVIASAAAAYALAANAEVEKKGVERSRPWRVGAARLIEALNDMGAEVKGPGVAEGVKRCVAELSAVEAGKLSGAAGLADWAENSGLAATELFKGDPESAVKPGKESGEEGKEDKAPGKEGKEPAKEGKEPAKKGKEADKKGKEPPKVREKK